MSEIDEARVRRYSEAIGLANNSETRERAARAVIAVADEEQAALRAQIERLVRHNPEHEARAVMVQTLYDLRNRAEAAEAEVERLRKRTHEIADEQQRRFAPYVSRCERFDTLRKWAREHSGLVDPDGHIPDKAGSAWTYTSEAIRTLVIDALERAEAAEAEVERLTDDRNVTYGALLTARRRAEFVEAEVERLTRECLDREATETDARERLRQVEATLTLDATHHVRRVWIERRGEVSWSCACGHVMKHQQMKDGYALIPMCPDDPRAAQAHAETFRD